MPENEWFFFQDTHEPIVDQDTWERANKLRKRAPKRTAFESKYHRLSGMVFCADCGSRMGYGAQNYKDKNRVWDPMSGGFQCGAYRSGRTKCSSHYISARQLEGALLKAVRAISQHVLEDSESFADQMMSQWELKQARNSADEQSELNAAKRRIAELDNLIKGLYESQINGTMPERQVQKLIMQYDEEESEIESRVSNLESKREQAAPKKGDINRFIALVKKYQNITELTDNMLYELIDKIVVHAPNGTRGNGRRQQIDICFSFVGNYMPSTLELSEEEMAAQRKAEREEKIREKGKRKRERQKAKITALKKAAETDSGAAAEYTAFLTKQRENRKKYREAYTAKHETDPAYQAEQAEREVKKAARERLAYFRKIKICELEVIARTDAEAAEVLKTRREKTAVKNSKAAEKRKAKMASDPEFAAQQAERCKKRNERVRKSRAALKELAKTDPDAAAKYAAMRERERENANRYNAEKRARNDASA